jgi:hypothetical protein
MAIEFRLDTTTSENLAFICESYSQSGWEIINIHSRAIGRENTHYEVLFKQAFDDVKIDELTAARAEIARLTAELAARDAAWSEAVKLNEAQAVNLKADEALIEGYQEEIGNLQTEIEFLKRGDSIPF